jgi:hypothetical protein
MTDTILYVEKDTDLMRSTLIAFGLADLFYNIDEAGSGVEVRIEDDGSAYRLTVNLSQEEIFTLVRQRGLPPLLPAILKPPSAGEQKALDAGTPLSEIQRKYRPAHFRGREIDYGEEKAKAEETRKAKKNKVREEGDVPQRHPEYPLWAHLCSYFGKGSAMRIGYPLVIHAWHAHQGEAGEALCQLILDCYGTFPNPAEDARFYWADTIKRQLDYPDFEIFGWKRSDMANVSALSIVSPTTSQGSNTVTGARVVNTETPEIFWLEVYLAFAGYMAVGMPFNSGSDVLLYYPLPRYISFSRVRRIAREYRQSEFVGELYGYSNFMPRAKVDALSQILYYQTMVKHFIQSPPERGRINAISGLVGYYYKDISTQIPFDETTFVLPAWLPLDADRTWLEEVAEILQAHYEIIHAIRGEYAEELEILTSYRRFTTFGDPDDWIDFAIAYSQHRFNKMVDSGWMPHLNLETVEKTLMNNMQKKDYRPILQNEGFRNVANAIRSCTVQLRYFKDVKNQQTAFKVRHGLGDDLRRRAHNPDDFIDDLGSFVHDYMRESSSVQANTGEIRPFISDDDLYQIIELVNEYGSRVVASLLVATGYASRFERK